MIIYPINPKIRKKIMSVKEVSQLMKEFVNVCFKIGLLIFLINCYNLCIMFDSEIDHQLPCEGHIKQLEEKVRTLQEENESLKNFIELNELNELKTTSCRKIGR
jgi:hypothetical protein